MSVRVIATGGTFDKRYDPIAGRLDFAETHLPQLLRIARPAMPVAVETAMLIDSLEMTDAHRARVLQACRAAPERAIVVVHGTDTMVETARALAAAALGKTVVLTGAMVPWTVADSDAAFNLGHAIACAQLLPSGTWVAMNGVARAWDDVCKNRALGRFESLGAAD